MDLPINNRIVLLPGRFYAIVAPVETMLASLNNNPVLDRYTSILIGGNFSRILDGINRTSGNFDIRRAFTVHQLLTILREDDHSIVIVEHDPTIYDDAGNAKPLVPPTMKALSRNCIFVLYAPTMDRSFAYLASAADHLYYYNDTSETMYPNMRDYPNTKTQNRGISSSQKTLI
jgi:DNA polymerase I